jgi:hypothetical protein
MAWCMVAPLLAAVAACFQTKAMHDNTEVCWRESTHTSGVTFRGCGGLVCVGLERRVAPTAL